MSHSLELFHDILFLNHRPWKFGKQSDIKFKQLLLEVKKEYYTHQPNYEVDFIKPLSGIRKYYHAIIEYEATAYLNDLHSEINAALSDNEKSYLVHVALTRLISQKLKETAQVIQERDYTPEQFDLKLQNKKVDTNIADESYILHLLKHHLVRLVMEIQDSYQEHLKEFSRMYWKSVRQQNLPVTIKYPEMIAKIAPHFDGDDIPEFGKDNLWFL